MRRPAATGVPGGEALPGALELARKLRPLSRRVPSRTRVYLDEAATAQRIAEERVWIPVLYPAPARWLEAALIIDTNASMRVWHKTDTMQPAAMTDSLEPPDSHHLNAADGWLGLGNVKEAEQELLASRLLAELAAEDDFDRAIAASTDKLAKLAADALAEHRAGLTEVLDPDRL